MLAALRRWVENRRQIRRRWQADARRLIDRDEPSAYYEAQRLATRSRASGKAGEFIHWAKAEAEVARISPHAQMDLAVVQAIVDNETRRATDLRHQGD
ncbi:hypothetical protein EZH22_29225 [Xanthobacter dioxanivorans]|uniref:Uncharacterized protein n=1 Tax=Xanthobacter dioxanivorans TaxID=2528964 RepID=A0A974PPC3_9HYPH|nr:hypothetical protein [Xanthobacter dioxanivorans]QRG06874.1 hypothetical protein EZH22_29225 [Xanthobacter dioxanivorans]